MYKAVDIKMMKIGIFGSRTLRDERVKILILEKIEELNVTKILTCQEAQGVSEVAQRVAKEKGLPLQLHFLNFRYLRGAFEHRSKEIIKESDYFMIIHDGISKGTSNEFELVKKSNKPYSYDKLENTPFERSVGFNIQEDWGNKLDDPFML